MNPLLLKDEWCKCKKETKDTVYFGGECGICEPGSDGNIRNHSHCNICGGVTSIA